MLGARGGSPSRSIFFDGFLGVAGIKTIRAFGGFNDVRSSQNQHVRTLPSVGLRYCIRFFHLLFPQPSALPPIPRSYSSAAVQERSWDSAFPLFATDLGENRRYGNESLTKEYFLRASGRKQGERCSSFSMKGLRHELLSAC